MWCTWLIFINLVINTYEYISWHTGISEQLGKHPLHYSSPKGFFNYSIHTEEVCYTLPWNPAKWRIAVYCLTMGCHASNIRLWHLLGARMDAECIDPHFVLAMQFCPVKWVDCSMFMFRSMYKNITFCRWLLEHKPFQVLWLMCRHSCTKCFFLGARDGNSYCKTSNVCDLSFLQSFYATMCWSSLFLHCKHEICKHSLPQSQPEWQYRFNFQLQSLSVLNCSIIWIINYVLMGCSEIFFRPIVFKLQWFSFYFHFLFFKMYVMIGNYFFVYSVS